MKDIAIRVENLGKAYRLGAKEERTDTFVGAVANIAMAPLRNFRKLRSLNTFEDSKDSDDILWALKNVSFDVGHGEVIGIIGRNGAGKSTLLKILSRIVEPTEGRVEIRGRVSSLLEVGTGFHPELSGRENVYMNGTILGMKKTEIDRKFDEIVEFSGVERFLDTPVKRYSSGMKVRLAFSVAAHLEPEILIIDEVLAVGDAEFQNKCLGKMQNVASSGRTVLFVSHHLQAVSNLCFRSLLFDSGSCSLDDKTDIVISRYLNYNKKRSLNKIKDRKDRVGKGNMRFDDFWIENARGERIDVVTTGETVKFVIKYSVSKDKDFKNVTCGLAINSINGAKIALFRTEYVQKNLDSIIFDGERIECKVNNFPLNIGSYCCNISCESSGDVEDFLLNVIYFSVQPGDFFNSGKIPDPERLVLIKHDWDVL